MSDLISREEAIGTLKKCQVVESDNFTNTDPLIMMTVSTIADCIEAIADLPSFEIEERIAKVERVDMDNKNSKVYKCFECGQYFHSTSWSRPVNYCSSCGAKLDWSNHELSN